MEVKKKEDEEEEDERKKRTNERKKRRLNYPPATNGIVNTTEPSGLLHSMIINETYNSLSDFSYK